jgi:hypothetical protein
MYGQSENSFCYALRVANKKYLADTLLLQPKLYLQGILLVTNGVYNFEINKKSFWYQRIHKITKDSIFAGSFSDSISTLKFSIKDNVTIYLSQCYQAKCGWPNLTNMTPRKYKFDIIETDKYCYLNSINLCPNCETEIIGFQYLTGFGLMIIYQKENEPYIIEGSQTSKLKKLD